MQAKEDIDNTSTITVRLSSVKCEELVGVYPSGLRNLKTTLKEHVQKKLFKWDSKQQGIVVSSKSVKQNGHQASIHDESPVIFVPTLYRLKLLNIKQSDLLIGSVNQTFDSHISLQLYGLFNVLIFADDISDKVLRLNSMTSEWMDAKKPSTVIEVGDEIQFEVKSVDVQEFGDFMLVGSLKNSKRTGSIDSIKQKYILANHQSVVSLVSKSLSKYTAIKD